jgi:hypothetical protein
MTRNLPRKLSERALHVKSCIDGTQFLLLHALCRLDSSVKIPISTPIDLRTDGFPPVASNKSTYTYLGNKGTCADLEVL